MRERGKLWPVISVGAGAFVVLFVLPLMLHRQESGKMATVEAHVSIGDAQLDQQTRTSSSNYRWPNSEVPRTAERLRDLTAVAIASMTYVVEGTLGGRPPRNVDQIINGIVWRDLIPREWVTSQRGVLQMPNGTVHLRYSLTSLSMEVLSIPRDRSDGPALLIRLPDSENTTVGPRYFESMQVDRILYPGPFARIPDVIGLGWRQCIFKQTTVSE